MLSRNTYMEVDLKALKENVKKIIRANSEYKYYIGVVKADCYGQGDGYPAKAIVEAGCNYLAVATLDEGLVIRRKIKDIPILCLGIIPYDYIDACKLNDITVTIPSLEYIKELEENDIDCSELKVHLKVNTGMNRLGMNTAEDVKEAIKKAKKMHMIIEGIYTHLYNAENEAIYDMQTQKFKEIIEKADAKNIPIIHMSASEGLMDYEKEDFVNGCRLGIVMYGFTDHQEFNLKTTARLISEVEQIHELKKGETVGYGGTYEAKEDGEKIAVVPIGYADGVIRKNKGRNVYINDKEYEIVGNICMDMLFVKIDDDVKLHDKVFILKDNKHILEVSNYLDTIPYEVLCEVGKRVKRVYK